MNILPTRCFLDVDGVLADFIGGANKLLGKEHPWLKPENHGKWGGEETYGLTPREFWDPMGEEFWANLEWTPEGTDIVDLVESAFGYENVSLLTTPCWTHGSVAGKIRWINENLPKYRQKFLIGYQKHFCASPNTVLVDDRDKNVEMFRDGGGFGVLVPRPWNSAYNIEPWLTTDLKIIFDILTGKSKDLKDGNIPQ